MSSKLLLSLILLFITCIPFISSSHHDEDATSDTTSPHSSSAHHALQILIENSRFDFHESALRTYFPVILSQKNIVYCQNLPQADPEVARNPHAHILDPSIVQKNVVNTLRQIFPKTDTKCTYLMSGWWIYEFCFQKYVRQFHQEQDQTVTMEYFLGYGTLNHDVHNFVLDKDDGQNSYVSFKFENGTKCDLTGRPRSTEVRFYCNTDQPMVENYFGHVEEPESCTYLAKYYMKKLCEFDGFGKKEEKIQSMQCLEKSEFEKFLAEKKAGGKKEGSQPAKERKPTISNKPNEVKVSFNLDALMKDSTQDELDVPAPLSFLDEQDREAAQADLSESSERYTQEFGSETTSVSSPQMDIDEDFERRLGKALSLDEDDYEQWEEGTTHASQTDVSAKVDKNEKDEL